MTSSSLNKKMTKPVLFHKAQSLEARLDAQERATQALFFICVLAIASAFIY